MEETLEFSVGKVSSLLAVMYVPRCFSVKKEKDGKIRAVPKGEYAGFISEHSANDFLQKLEKAFNEKKITNFADIKRCSLLSKDTIKIAKEMQRKGNKVLLRAFRASNLSNKIDARTMDDFSKVSWYALLGKKRHNFGCLEIQNGDNGMVWVDLPGTDLRIKAGLGLIRDLESQYGKLEFSLGTNKTVTHIRADIHGRLNAKD